MSFVLKINIIFNLFKNFLVCVLPASGQELTWEDAQVGSRVHQVNLFGDAVCDEEAAGAGGADVSRH